MSDLPILLWAFHDELPLEKSVLQNLTEKPKGGVQFQPFTLYAPAEGGGCRYRGAAFCVPRKLLEPKKDSIEVSDPAQAGRLEIQKSKVDLVVHNTNPFEKDGYKRLIDITSADRRYEECLNQIASSSSQEELVSNLVKWAEYFYKSRSLKWRHRLGTLIAPILHTVQHLDEVSSSSSAEQILQECRRIRDSWKDSARKPSEVANAVHTLFFGSGEKFEDWFLRKYLWLSSYLLALERLVENPNSLVSRLPDSSKQQARDKDWVCRLIEPVSAEEFKGLRDWYDNMIKVIEDIRPIG